MKLNRPARTEVFGVLWEGFTQRPQRGDAGIAENEFFFCKLMRLWIKVSRTDHRERTRGSRRII